MEQFYKSPEQLAGLLEKWFLTYHSVEKSGVTGAEPFTLFERISPDRQQQLLKRINLKPHEIPVLVLSATIGEVIINTTDRFVRLSDAAVESLAYADFGGHKGFEVIALGKAAGTLKTAGAIKLFRLTKRNGEVVYWPVPTGAPGFAFWNVTKHCERIGRRYILKTGD